MTRTYEYFVVYSFKNSETNGVGNVNIVSDFKLDTNDNIRATEKFINTNCFDGKCNIVILNFIYIKKGWR